MVHLPSLQTLRALEAADRLRSYSKAAAELGLTHGAISHRIRALELSLGRTLFERDGNAMRATPAGQELVVQVRQALSLLDQAFATPASAARTSRQVVVTVVPGLAQTWLFVRLQRFREAHPDIDIMLRISADLADFKRDGVDIGVRAGLGAWPNLNAEKLFDEVLTPVCTPEYRDCLQLRAPCDLARAVLFRNVWTPWALWFKAAGLTWPEPTTGPSFDDSAMLLRATLLGGGVALARYWLAIDDLRAGRLVAPFPISVRDPLSYWIVWPTRRNEPEGVRAFRDWLRAEAAAETAPVFAE